MQLLEVTKCDTLPRDPAPAEQEVTQHHTHVSVPAQWSCTTSPPSEMFQQTWQRLHTWVSLTTPVQL